MQLKKNVSLYFIIKLDRAIRILCDAHGCDTFSIIKVQLNDFSRKQEEEEEGVVKGFDGPRLNVIRCKCLIFRLLGPY